MTISQELLKIIQNKENSSIWLKRKQGWRLSISNYVIWKDRRLCEQQIEELHSFKMKVQEQKIVEGQGDEEVFKWGL